jgi:hypothetical protein
MIPFVVYWLAALSTAISVLTLVAFAVWGRPTSPMELISLGASVGIAIGAFLSLSMRRAAGVLVLVSSLGAWSYLAPALNAVAHNIRRGGSYPVQSLIPAVLLACAMVLAGIEVWRNPVSAPQGRLRVILIAVVVFLVSPFLVMNPNRTPVDLFVLRKVVSVPMHWQKRTDVFARPHHYVLEYPRSAGECGTEFWGHPELGTYLESLGSRPVPVIYEVYYDENGEAMSANFMRVGRWPASWFGPNEGSLSSGVAVVVTGSQSQPMKSRNPQDCFDPVR